MDLLFFPADDPSADAVDTFKEGKEYRTTTTISAESLKLLQESNKNAGKIGDEYSIGWSEFHRKTGFKKYHFAGKISEIKDIGAHKIITAVGLIEEGEGSELEMKEAEEADIALNGTGDEDS